MRLSADERRAGPAPARRTRTRAFWAWIPPLAYMALIFHLSSLSDPLPALTAHVWDKALHFTEYGTLAVLLTFAFRASGLRGWRALLLAAIVTSFYGASDEVHQAFVPGRDPDVHDWLADTLGAALGVGIATLALRVHAARASIRGTRRRAPM